MPTVVDVNRLKGILLQPGSTWKAIDGEFTKPAALYKGWVLPLALIGPVSWMVGTFIFGVGSVVGPYRLSIQSLVTVVVIDYVVAVLAIFGLSTIISVLAPTFGGQKNDVQALKVAAYAATPWLVAGVFQLLPVLWPVRLVVSLYGLYMVFAGVPIVMKPAKDQALGYGIVAALGAAVVALIVHAIHIWFTPDFRTGL
jgi:hypothetical protein